MKGEWRGDCLKIEDEDGEPWIWDPPDGAGYGWRGRDQGPGANERRDKNRPASLGSSQIVRVVMDAIIPPLAPHLNIPRYSGSVNDPVLVALNAHQPTLIGWDCACGKDCQTPHGYLLHVREKLVEECLKTQKQT